MIGWLEHLFELSQAKQNHAVVTLVGIRGSAPQIVGAKMIVTENGLLFGTIGGGKVEAHCIRLAQELLHSKSSPQMLTFSLQKDIGMTCGGEVSIFFDTFLFTQWTVAIFGAGHVSLELCRVIQTWSCQVKVFDTRKEWLDKLVASPNIVKKLSEDLSEEVLGLPKGTYLLSLTQGHSADVPVLEVALKNINHFQFVGVIGSDIKALRIKDELTKLQVPCSSIAQLHCPIGLEFGDNTPPEIAISIAAQILMLKSKVHLNSDEVKT